MSNVSVNATQNSPQTLPVMLYMSYKDVPLAPALVIPASVLALIAATGIVFNLSVIYVTIRANLRGTCHFLLALASFFEVCHQVNHFVYFYNVTLGPKFIDYYLCIKIMTIPTLGSNALQITLLGTAIDRLLSIKAPIFYKNNNDSMRQKFLYLGAFCTVIFGYGIYSAGYFLINAAKYKGINVLCDISDTFLAEMYNYYVYNTFVLDIITATLYVFVWKAIRKNVQATDIQDRLFKSLLAIVILNVGGYFVNLGLMFVGLSYLPWPWSWYQFEFNGVLLNVCAAMNAPILFWMSTEYRNAFKRYMPFCCKFSENTSSFVRSGPQSTAVSQPNGGSSPVTVRNFLARTLRRISIQPA